MLGFLWNLPTPLSTSYLGALLLPLSVKPSISPNLTQRNLLPLTFSFFILFYFIFLLSPFLPTFSFVIFLILLLLPTTLLVMLLGT